MIRKLREGIGDIVSWSDLNDEQKDYAVNYILNDYPSIYWTLREWFDDLTMEDYQYDVQELAKEYEEQYGLNIDTDKLYWQSNSQGPYPKWDLGDVFGGYTVPISDDAEYQFNIWGRGTDVELDEQSIYYHDTENDYPGWHWATPDEYDEEYGIPKSVYDEIDRITDGAQDFIDKVWSMIHDVCTSFPDEDWIYDALEANDYGKYEIISETEAKPL